MHRRSERMSRAARTARGALGAALVTLFAAASHALAGGRATLLAILATAALALPLCTALAGRVGSLWRLSLAVGLGQFVYHWSFSGLGAPTIASGASAATGPHAAHLGMLIGVPSPLPAGGASAAMWAAHALAASCTVLLMHRGERAAILLIELVFRAALPVLTAIAPTAVGPRPALGAAPRGATLAERLFCPAAITHRGPPRIA